jgi:hypothetical protein
MFYGEDENATTSSFLGKKHRCRRTTNRRPFHVQGQGFMELIMNSKTMINNGKPLQTPVAWHLGAIVGLTVIAFLVIWLLTSLAHFAKETGSPAPRDTRSAYSADYAPWTDGSISPIRTDILNQFPEDAQFLEEMPIQDEGEVASQSRFEIESLE